MWGGGGRGGVQVGGCQGRCERKLEVFVKIQKKKIGGLGGRVGGVRVDVNEELKFWGKFTHKQVAQRATMLT